MHPAEDSVEHGDQRQKRDQHAAHVERQEQAIVRALGRRVDDVHRSLLDFDFHLARGDRFASLRDEDLGQHDGGRRGHNHGRQQVGNGDVRHHDIRRHHRTGDVRHAAGHDGKKLGLRQPFEERLDSEGRFGLSHEDAGRDVERFGAAYAHDFLHHDGHPFHDPLHHAQVIQDGKERREC